MMKAMNIQGDLEVLVWRIQGEIGTQLDKIVEIVNMTLLFLLNQGALFVEKQIEKPVNHPKNRLHLW